jgi:hypothetical protein
MPEPGYPHLSSSLLTGLADRAPALRMPAPATVASGFMASRLALRHRYPAPPERIQEVLTDRQYLQDKLRAVGGPRAELASWEQDERGVTFVLRQSIPEDAIPPFIRAVLSGELTIKRTETWNGAGGTVHAVVDGAPGTITGVMRFEPDPAGCVLGAQLSAEVPLPLIGGKVEKVITDNIGKLMDTEYRFTLEWLRNSG